MDANPEQFQSFAADSASAARPEVRMDGAGYRIQPLRAFRAVKNLIKDKEDTTQVFEIMTALSGKAIPKGYQRLLSSPSGGRIAYEREEFADRLMDRDWLDQFGPGTVGAAYRDFIAPRQLSAEGLAEESRKVKDTQIDAAHPHVWYARRMRDVHDVWHVLTGYSTDALGEGCVVAFSFAQTGSLGFALIALAAGNQFEKARNGQPYSQAIREAWDAGRKAAWLPAVDYPALFAENLEDARVRLRIGTPVIYRAIPQHLKDRFEPEALQTAAA